MHREWPDDAHLLGLLVSRMLPETRQERLARL